MKKNKKVRYKNLFMFFALFSAVSLTLLLFGGSKKVVQEVAVGSLQNNIRVSKQTIYPLQFNDRNITLNAKVTDERFKNLSVFPKDDLVGNAISAVTLKSGSEREGIERGTWLWTPPVYITDKYINEIVSGAKKNNINTIYMSLDTYLDIFVMPLGEEKEKAKENFENTLEKFIKKANENGIVVDAEAGWQNWAEKGNNYKPDIILDFVINFNKTHTAKFRGFQYDVEVYLLPEYQDNKEKILTNFLNLIDGTVSKLNNTDLLFSVVVPEFYDGSTPETPDFKYKGNRGFAFDHLLNILDRRRGSSVIIMSYRNFSNGDDGSIDVSKDEIRKGNTSKTKVIIAQETGDVPPPYITFWNTSRNYMNKQQALLYSAFEKEKSFGGTAIHYINSYLEIR